MHETVEELTLLLLYLTSWKENDVLTDMRRSWKGYPFEILDKLNEENSIIGSKRARSVYLTEEGIHKAERLMKKYNIQ